MKKETILKILRKELGMTFDKATYAEWIKIDTAGSQEDFEKGWAMLPDRINLGKIADKLKL